MCVTRRRRDREVGNVGSQKRILIYFAILSIGLTQEGGGWEVAVGDFFDVRQYHCLTLSTQQSEENLNLHDCDCGTLKLGKPIARGP